MPSYHLLRGIWDSHIKQPCGQAERTAPCTNPKLYLLQFPASWTWPRKARRGIQSAPFPPEGDRKERGPAATHRPSGAVLGTPLRRCRCWLLLLVAGNDLWQLWLQAAATHLNYFRNPKITARRGTLSSFSGMAAVNNLLGVVRVTGFWPRAAGRRCRGPCGSTHCFTEEALRPSDGPGGGFQEFIRAPAGISSASPQPHQSCFTTHFSIWPGVDVLGQKACIFFNEDTQRARH